MTKSCSNDFGSLEIKCIADVTVITNMKRQDLETRDVVRQKKELSQK